MGISTPTSVSDTPRTTRRVETDRNVEDFLENYLEGVCFAVSADAVCATSSPVMSLTSTLVSTARMFTAYIFQPPLLELIERARLRRPIRK
jgi:hypothetical protein